ncbi:MAG: serine/threonine protein kinase/TPR repeat protein [Kiritimatiellia bacterium]|jgi:serine/threonine protein kinase/TPR repeat protein
MAEEEIHFGQFVVRKTEDGKWPILGRGGMGVTYKAFDSSLHREVALKVISQHLLDDPHMKRMFIREARSAATLTHRNVAQVYQVGADEETWYAMEFIPGKTTEQLLQQRRKEGHTALDLYLALDIGLQTVRALAAAEKQHLVHRDIKPSNIMVMIEDEENVVKLIDFGLAKTLKPSGEASQFVSRAGFMGTPMFASPEQITDKAVDIRSDIYGLGATLWFMIEGRPPFESENQFQLYNQQLNEPPPVERLQEQEIPECVIKLLQHMLEKKAEDRPQTARDLFGMFRDCLAHLPSNAGINIGESMMHTHASLRPTQHVEDVQTRPEADAAVVPFMESEPPLMESDPPTSLHMESEPPTSLHMESEPPTSLHMESEPPTSLHMESEPPTSLHMESEPPTKAAEWAPAAADSEYPTRAASNKSHASRQPRPVAMIASVLVAVVLLGGGLFAYKKLIVDKKQGPGIVVKKPDTPPPPDIVPPPAPPPPTGLQPAERLAALQELHRTGQSAAAFPALMTLMNDAQEPAVKEEAGRLVHAMLEAWNADANLDINRLETLRPVLSAGASEDDPQATLLLSRLLAKSDPAESARLATRAASSFEALGQGEQSLAALLRAHALTPTPQRSEILNELNRIITTTSSGLPPTLLSAAATAGSTAAMKQLASSLPGSDETEAFTWSKTYAEQMALTKQWPEALQTYLDLLKNPSHKAFASGRLNDVFKTWQRADGPPIAELLNSQDRIQQAAGLAMPEAMLVLARIDAEQAPAEAHRWMRLASDAFGKVGQWDRQLEILTRTHDRFPSQQAFVAQRLATLATTLGDPETLPGPAFTSLRPMLEQAARTGSAPMMMLLGKRLQGIDDKEAFRHFNNAAPNDAEASEIAAGLLAEGRGTSKDLRQASKLYRAAGESFTAAGHIPEGFKAFFQMYTFATGSERMDAQQVLEGMVSRFTTAEPGYDAKTFVATVPMLSKLAAMDHLPTMQLLGERLSQTQPEVAFDWMLKATTINARERSWEQTMKQWLLMKELFPKQQPALIKEINQQLKPLLEPIYTHTLVSEDIQPLVDELKELSTLPSPAAALLLFGYYHQLGEHTEDVKWLQSMTPQSSFAQIQLGLHYSNGDGISTNQVEAFKLFQQAHASGDPDALVPLADCYYRAMGTEANPAKTVELLQAASETGNARAKDMLGSLYNIGIPNVLPKDHAKAFALFDEAARRKNYGRAYANLGVMYLRTYTDGPEALTQSNPNMAVNMWEKGLELDDQQCRFFLFNYGVQLHKAAQETEGRRLIQLAADHGMPEAKTWLTEHPLR